MKNKWLWITGGGVLLLLLIGGLLKMSSSVKPRVKTDSVKTTNPSPKPQEMFERAVDFQKENEFDKAQETYEQIMNTYPDYEGVETVQKELETLNLKLILTSATSPFAVLHQVQSGDTLGKLAKKYGTTVELIKRRNNLSSDVIRLGQKLSIWTGVFNIFVDKSQNILILKNGEKVVKVFDVSTGSNNSTPIGTFKIISKLVDPVWYKAGAVIPPESPQNELGTRWMGFDIEGYGIHGTIEPDKMRQQVTAGCVRMRNPEVEELFDIIPLGTVVTVVD